MNSSLSFLAALAWFVFISALGADEKFDFHQSESPRKPAPEWLRIIDQGTRDARFKGYFTPEGIKLEIVADFPAVRNPVGMTFALDGTPYVLEWTPDAGTSLPEYTETITYKDGSKRGVATMKKRVKDLVKVLVFNKEKGVYDQSKIIWEDELPSSILLHDGWLYLSGRGTVRRYRRSKPDGPYDVKETIAQGFCGFHHHQVSGMTIGNDGWLYISAGDDDNVVEGSDGSRATVLRTGAIFRCRPDGSNMNVWSIGYRNPYRDVAFDASFNMFHADNDNEDGSKFQGCRLMHVADVTDFGWRLHQGARCCQPDTVRGAVFGELPGKMPPLLKTGRGAPAGLMIYNESYFPEPYRGLLYYPDVYRKLIRAYKVQPAGSTFEVVEEFELMKCDDPLFRPCQMVAGPDGAMYIVDWRTNSGGAGQLWGDGQHGRIWRLTWAGTAKEPALGTRPIDSWEKLTGRSTERLAETLKGPDFSDRLVAQRELVKRKERKLLLKVLAGDEQPLCARIAALGGLESMWNDEVETAFVQALQHEEPDIRRLAADALARNTKKGNGKVHEALLAVLADPNLAVRRSVILAMGQVGGPGAYDNIASSFQFDDGKDAYLTDAFVRAFERGGKDGLERLLALADSGDPKLIDRVAEVYQGMRCREAAELLPALLKSPHLNATQRANLLRSYANYLLLPPISFEPVIEFLARNAGDDREIRLAGVEVLTSGLPVNAPAVEPLFLKFLDDDDPRMRMAVIDGIAQLRLAKTAPRLVKLLGEPSRPTAEHIGVVRALGLLGDKSTSAVLQELLDKKENSVNLKLRMEAFRSLANLDADAAQGTARKLLEDKDSATQIEAVRVLGARPEGARLVAQMLLDGKLPRELLQAVSEVLARHAGKDAEAAALLARVLKGGLVIANDKASREKMREQVQSKGNADRGRALYLDGKLLACSNCHRMEGVGGNVGPDLTRLWDTQTLDKLIESIVEPSKEIKEGFQAYTATTKKGLTFTGLKITQTTDEVVLREASGKDIHIATRDLEELTASKKSLMPDNVISQLNYNQFLDLLAFLTSRSAQESLRGLVLDCFVLGPFEDELKASQPAEIKPSPDAKYKGQKPNETLLWQPAQAASNGLLDLRSIFPKENVSAYVLTYVHSPKKQKVSLLLGAGGSVRVWLNDQLVHEQPKPRRAWPDEDRVEFALDEGWNSLLVKVHGSAAEHSLYLRFSAGEGLRIARRPQER